MPENQYSVRADFYFAASFAAIHGNQFPPFDVELLFLVHRPLVVAVAAEGPALVLLLRRRFAQRQDIGHPAAPVGILLRSHNLIINGNNILGWI